MNGWINEARSKPPDRWKIILDLGQQPGRRSRKQKWSTFKGTRKEAERHLRQKLGEADRGEYIESSKQTVGEWLDVWLAKVVKPLWRERTYLAYENAVRSHLKPRLGSIRLQKLQPSDIRRYHAELGLAPATGRMHHNALSAALSTAVEENLIHRNVATLAKRPSGQRQDDRLKAWTGEEARAVLAVAKTYGAQAVALLAMAMDSGARKGELQGFRWSDVDLTTGSLTIERQFLKYDAAGQPVFGPTKSKKRKARVLDLSGETVTLLREHKRAQAELKLANRLHYTDYGLIFAQAWEHQSSRHASLGAPLNSSAILTTMTRLIRDANVRRITVHGLRHTSATLLLAAGVQPHVVQKRLGHASVVTTLNLYAHVIPSMQQDAASRLAGLLYR